MEQAEVGLRVLTRDQPGSGGGGGSSCRRDIIPQGSQCGLEVQVDDVEELDAGESLVPETLSNTDIIEIVPQEHGDQFMGDMSEIEPQEHGDQYKEQMDF
jgi:hypothetical protein